MTNFCFRAFVLFIVILNCTKGIIIEKQVECETCVPKYMCPEFTKQTIQDQQRWLAEYSCSNQQAVNRKRNEPFNSYICCPNSLQISNQQYAGARDLSTNTYDRKRNRDYFKNFFSNSRFDQNDDNYPAYKRQDNQYGSTQWDNTQYDSTEADIIRTSPRENMRPYRRNQYNNGMNRIGNGNVRQCNSKQLSSFPPDPSSGCCGRDVSGDNRIETPNRRKNPVPANNFNFVPSWSLPPNFDEYPTRFKRDLVNLQNMNVTFDNRITGGIATDLEDYPWTVLLKITFDSGTSESTFNCGGSLISRSYVLTAAHCVIEEGAKVKGITIYLAEYDKTSFPTDCMTSRSDGRKCIENIVMYSEDIIPHEKYDAVRLLNDIALIRLRGMAPYSDYIRPICLPTTNIEERANPSLRLAVAGWGRNGTRVSNIKQSAFVNLVSRDKCQIHYSALTNVHICAAGYSGEDTCKGDSGGPLMSLKEGTYYVSGIVSGKRIDSPCGTSVPSLYTNVYIYLDWIKRKIRSDQ